jgi:hypothetical protein
MDVALAHIHERPVEDGGNQGVGPETLPAGDDGNDAICWERVVSPEGIEPSTNRLRVGQPESADVQWLTFWFVLTKAMFGKCR